MFEGFGDTPEEIMLRNMVDRAKSSGAASVMSREEAMDAMSRLSPEEVSNAFKLIAQYERGV